MKVLKRLANPLFMLLHFAWSPMTCREAEQPGEGGWSGMPVGSMAMDILLAPVRLQAMTLWMMHQETNRGMNHPGPVEQGFVTFPSRLK